MKQEALWLEMFRAYKHCIRVKPWVDAVNNSYKFCSPFLVSRKLKISHGVSRFSVTVVAPHNTTVTAAHCFLCTTVGALRKCKQKYVTAWVGTPVPLALWLNLAPSWRSVYVCKDILPYYLKESNSTSVLYSFVIDFFSILPYFQNNDDNRTLCTLINNFWHRVRHPLQTQGHPLPRRGYIICMLKCHGPEHRIK